MTYLNAPTAGLGLVRPGQANPPNGHPRRVHWAEPYIGIPWSATGEGPASGEEGRRPDRETTSDEEGRRPDRETTSGGDDRRPGRETWSYHCWAFVRHIQKMHFGRDLPGIPNPEDVLAIARGFRDHPERRRWKRVKAPIEGDCVLMRQARYPIHVGVWLDVDNGGVLHCSQEAGVAFQTLNSLSLNGWTVDGFYRCLFDDPCRRFAAPRLLGKK